MRIAVRAECCLPISTHRWMIFSDLPLGALVLERKSIQILNMWYGALTLQKWVRTVHPDFTKNIVFPCFLTGLGKEEGTKQYDIHSVTPMKYLPKVVKARVKLGLVKSREQTSLSSPKENDKINPKSNSAKVAEWVGWVRDFFWILDKRGHSSYSREQHMKAFLFLWLPHPLICYDFLHEASVPSREATALPNLVLSAILLSMYLSPRSRSLIKISKKTGPRGIPLLTSHKSDAVPITTTLWGQPVSQLFPITLWFSLAMY